MDGATFVSVESSEVVEQLGPAGPIQPETKRAIDWPMVIKALIMITAVLAYSYFGAIYTLSQ
ncbi:hypothetical protein SAMN04515648_4585 [Phyllobacterium sp. CL33Tsu]|nr:hypothetical protein SAMN04515648_4585 [Phyllobacterium sp. CL33Tsu]